MFALRSLPRTLLLLLLTLPSCLTGQLWQPPVPDREQATLIGDYPMRCGIAPTGGPWFSIPAVGPMDDPGTWWVLAPRGDKHTIAGFIHRVTKGEGLGAEAAVAVWHGCQVAELELALGEPPTQTAVLCDIQRLAGEPVAARWPTKARVIGLAPVSDMPTFAKVLLTPFTFVADVVLFIPLALVEVLAP